MSRLSRVVPTWKTKRLQYRLATVALLLELAEQYPDLRERLVKMAWDLRSCPLANRDDEASGWSSPFPCGLVELCAACRRVQCYHLSRSYQARAELLAASHPEIRGLFVTIEFPGRDPFVVDQELRRIEDALWRKTTDPTSAASVIVGLLAIRDASLDGGDLNGHRHCVLLVDSVLAREFWLKSGFRWAPQTLASLLRRILVQTLGREVPEDSVHVEPLYAHSTDDLAVTLPPASPRELGKHVRRVVDYARKWSKPGAYLSIGHRVFLALAAARKPDEERLSPVSRPMGLWRGVIGWEERKKEIQARDRKEASKPAHKKLARGAVRTVVLPPPVRRKPGRPQRAIPVDALVASFQRHAGCVAAVARDLGIPRRTIADHLRRLAPEVLGRRNVAETPQGSTGGTGQRPHVIYPSNASPHPTRPVHSTKSNAKRREAEPSAGRAQRGSHPRARQAHSLYVTVEPCIRKAATAGSATAE